MNEERSRRKIKTGRIVSDKMDKTVVVAVERVYSHPFYGKTIKQITKLKAHAEKGKYKVNDLVEIMETRPISRGKSWRVVRLIEK